MVLFEVRSMHVVKGVYDLVTRSTKGLGGSWVKVSDARFRQGRLGSGEVRQGSGSGEAR